MNLFHNIVSRFSGTIAFAAVLSIAITASASAVTNTASAGTTWEAATWSQGHVPLAAEDAVINSGINLTINSAAVCGSLTIGNTTVTATGLTINAGYSLTISGTTGNLTLNPSNVNVAMTLIVGANTLTVAGTPALSATNTSSITASTGSVSFTKATGFTWAGGNNHWYRCRNHFFYRTAYANRWNDTKYDCGRNVQLQRRIFKIRRNIYFNGCRDIKLRRQFNGNDGCSDIQCDEYWRTLQLQLPSHRPRPLHSEI